jgi:hypothetical protein
MSRCGDVFLLVVLIALSSPAPGHAQNRLIELRPGTRIRVHLRDSLSAPIEGTMLDIRGETLFLSRLGDTTSAPLRDVYNVEAQIRQNNEKQGARIGLALGALAGFVVAGKKEAPTCPKGELFCWDFTDLLAPVFLGSILGACAGALVGSQVGKTEWRQMPFDMPRVGLTMKSGNVGIAVRLIH